MDKIDDKDNEKPIGSMTPEELLADIQKEEPDYDPQFKTNVINLRPSIDISDYIPLTIKDFENSPVVPTEYICHPCIPTQGICFIYAASGIGKTLFSLNLAYAIAAGGNFLTYKCPLPRKILYIDGEMKFSQIHSRIMQIIEYQGHLDFKENWHVFTPDKLAPRRVPKIDDALDQELYIKIIEKYNIDVVIFDNVSLLSSIDENKANEWKIVQDFLLKIKVMGKTSIVIHHAGKDKNGYRGTSRMLDCADTAISLQDVNDNSLEAEQIKGKRFKIVYQKTRDFSGKDALPFEVNLENGIWHSKSLEQTDMDRIIEMVGLKMTQRDISKDLGISLGKVNKLIRKARDLKLIRD
jgi:putative DNA primase/helicase